MSQHGLTVITEVLPDKVASLQALLNAIGTDIDENPHIHFYDLDTVHFMRWVMLPAARVQGVDLPPQLVLSTNYDGNLNNHLAELTERETEGIRKIYSHCKGFPTKGDAHVLATWLKKHSKRNAAFYVGTVGKKQPQIKKENRLRNKIEEVLQTGKPSQDWQGQPPDGLRNQIRSQIEEAEPDHFWNYKHHSSLLQTWGKAIFLGVLLFLIGLLVVAWAYNPWWSILPVALLGFMGIWFWRLRFLEEKDKAQYVPSPNLANEIKALNQREDYRVQNQITHLVNVKPGWVRQFALRLMLYLINVLARLWFNKGSLAGIRSIHFARWVIIDGGKRLLFLSNYDGSWESYLGEFIDRAAVGLTGVWSNTEGFPPTRALVMEGARHSIQFKAWVRNQQIETQVWFSAYKTISVDNIHNNTSIRNGMPGHLTASGSEAWLQRL